MIHKSISKNIKTPPLEGGYSYKFGGMLMLKHDIISTNLYKLLLKSELKEATDIDMNNFYNSIKMSLNTVANLREIWYPPIK